ncbi:MAG: hypothetical protein WEA79_11045 [Balneolaceae bacterium]
MSMNNTHEHCTDCGGSLKPAEKTFVVGYHSQRDTEVVRNIPTMVCTECKLEWIIGKRQNSRQ